jgi:tRNA threonylcarbamoyladenosine biosynthesis protein TsaB
MTVSGPSAILALDSSGAACSVALWADGGIAAHRFEPMQRGQAERLMPMVVAAMAEARRGFAELDLIAVCVGPGSFTGLRVGLATARGLALAGATPAGGVTAFDAALESVTARPAGKTIAVAIDSRRGDLFVQFFDSSRRPLGGPAILAPPALRLAAPGLPLLVAGDGAALARPHLAADDEIAGGSAGPVDARFIAQLAARRGGAGLLPPVPLYLRAVAASIADVSIAGRPARTR